MFLHMDIQLFQCHLSRAYILSPFKRISYICLGKKLICPINVDLFLDFITCFIDIYVVPFTDTVLSCLL